MDWITDKITIDTGFSAVGAAKETNNSQLVSYLNASGREALIRSVQKREKLIDELQNVYLPYAINELRSDYYYRRWKAWWDAPSPKNREKLEYYSGLLADKLTPLYDRTQSMQSKISQFKGSSALDVVTRNRTEKNRAKDASAGAFPKIEQQIRTSVKTAVTEILEGIEATKKRPAYQEEVKYQEQQLSTASKLSKEKTKRIFLYAGGGIAALLILRKLLKKK